MDHVRRYFAKLRQDDQELQRHVAELDSVWDRRSIATLGGWIRRSFENHGKPGAPTS